MVPWSPGRLATWRGPLPPPLHHRLWPKCLQASSRRRRGCKKVRKTARAGVESVPRQSSRRAPEPARATRLKMKQESFLFLLKRNCLSQPAGPEAPSPPGCRGAGGVLSGIPPSPPALPAAVWARTPEVLGTVWGRCLDGRLWRPGAPAWPRRGEVSLLLAPCTPVAPTVGITAGHRPGPGALCPPPWLAAGALGESVACWEPHGSGSGLGGAPRPLSPGLICRQGRGTERFPCPWLPGAPVTDPGDCAGAALRPQLCLGDFTSHQAASTAGRLSGDLHCAMAATVSRTGSLRLPPSCAVALSLLSPPFWACAPPPGIPAGSGV